MRKGSIIVQAISAISFICCLAIFVIFMAPCRYHVQIRPSNPNVQKQIQALREFRENFIIMPGQVSFVRFPYFGPFKFETLVCNNSEIPYYAQDAQAIAYVVQSYFAKDNFGCEFRFTDDDNALSYTSLPIGTFTVNEFKYPEEFLKVDQKKVVLSPNDRERADNEKLMLAKIYQNSERFPLFKDRFTAPLTSKITSIYGTKRIFNNHIQTEHLGTDYRAKIGTEIFASNNGKVVFTGDLFFGGNTVVMDHGLGIFTSYSHLSQIIAKVGQQVSKKSLLGLSGMTGRVSGPHLHWGVNVHGNWTDGQSLIEASKKNFINIEELKAAQ